MIDYQKYIGALRKCAKEHEYDRTPTGDIIVSYSCRDTANLLEDLEQKPCETQMIDKSNFSQEQYKADLQSAYDCGKASVKPCDDAVSREFMYKLGATCIATRDKNDKLIALGTIENLPSVTPVQKTGKWEWEEEWTPSSTAGPAECDYAGWVCSECGESPDEYAEWDNPYKKPTYKYCPNCGAKMTY